MVRVTVTYCPVRGGFMGQSRESTVSCEDDPSFQASKMGPSDLNLFHLWVRDRSRQRTGMDKNDNMGKDEETNLSLPGAFFGRSASKGTQSVW